MISRKHFKKLNHLDTQKESNPVSDLNGEDVASKLKILTALSFNSYINNKDITVESLGFNLESSYKIDDDTKKIFLKC